jgi:hypothetical protein
MQLILTFKHEHVIHHPTVVTDQVVQDVYWSALAQSTRPPDAKRDSLKRNSHGKEIKSFPNHIE